MREDEFDELIEKYLQGKTSMREERMLEKWYDSMGKKMPSKSWSPAQEERVLGRIRERIEFPERRDVKVVRTSFMRPWMKVAATVLIMVVAYVGYTTFVGTGDKATSVTESSGGSQRKVMLADGSIVWLKENSRMDFSYTSDSIRSVVLEGEALFEVAKDARHPFVIRCNGLEATVVGTSFNIRSRGLEVEVTVLTGRVALQGEEERAEQIFVNPFERAVFSNETKALTKAKATASECTSIVEHTSYDLRAENIRVGDLVAKLGDKFNVEMVIENEALKDCRITADFSDRRLDESLEVLASVFDFKYSTNKDTIVLLGGRCGSN